MRAPKLFLLLCAISLPYSTFGEGLSAEEIRAALANPARAEEDRARDEGRKPADVLAYLGLQKGMTVLDVGASGGWYTEVFSLAVGDSGKVYAQNTQGFLQYNNGFYAKAIAEKLKAKHLGNVTRLDAEFDALGLDGTVDIALTALNFHDIYYLQSPEAAMGLLQGVKKALKPGGVFAVIDHEGNEGADNASLHRIDSKIVIEMAKQAGFEVDVSNLLRNDADDHTQGPFGPLRGKTDRFLLKLTKPKM